ncbi:MAG: hypothetical protein AMXMBFR33_41340 [Candidatus Xenobia bacterium]
MSPVRHQDRYGSSPLPFEEAIADDLTTLVARTREQVAERRAEQEQARLARYASRSEHVRRLTDLATVLGSTARHLHAVYVLRAMGVGCGYSQDMARDHAGELTGVVVKVGHEFEASQGEECRLTWDGSSYCLDGQALGTDDPEAVIAPLAAQVAEMAKAYASRRLNQ